MVWKANIDVQFVAECSLVLTHYVSGYVTKAENNMQDIWQEVSENKSIYRRLLSFAFETCAFESLKITCKIFGRKLVRIRAFIDVS